MRLEGNSLFEELLSQFHEYIWWVPLYIIWCLILYSVHYSHLEKKDKIKIYFAFLSFVLAHFLSISGNHFATYYFKVSKQNSFDVLQRHLKVIKYCVIIANTIGWLFIGLTIHKIRSSFKKLQ